MKQFIWILVVSVIAAVSVAQAAGFDDLKAGYDAANRGDHDEALRLYTKAITSRELSTEQQAMAFNNRGNAWNYKQDYDRAIVDYSEAIRLNPQFALAFDGRGLAWNYKQDYDRAIADYSEAIRLNRKDAYAFNGRGLAWYNKKDYDRAIADYNEAIRLNPQDAKAFNGRGIVWYNKQDYDRAIADYDEAIRLNPQDAKAFRNRGFVRFYQGQFLTAAVDLAQSQQLSPNNYSAIWLYLARARSGANDAKSELAANTNGIKRDWPAPVVALYLGNSNPDVETIMAPETDPKKHKEQMCEANFYIGEWYLIRGDKVHARLLFSKAESECLPDFFEYAGAVSELRRLK